ncbi:hypothetical protein BH11BAC2_BH11BAC2_26250 [soil metagenome]
MKSIAIFILLFCFFTGNIEYHIPKEISTEIKSYMQVNSNSYDTPIGTYCVLRNVNSDTTSILVVDYYKNNVSRCDSIAILSNRVLKIDTETIIPIVFKEDYLYSSVAVQEVNDSIMINHCNSVIGGLFLLFTEKNGKGIILKKSVVK